MPQKAAHRAGALAAGLCSRIIERPPPVRIRTGVQPINVNPRLDRDDSFGDITCNDRIPEDDLFLWDNRCGGRPGCLRGD